MKWQPLLWGLPLLVAVVGACTTPEIEQPHGDEIERPHEPPNPPPIVPSPTTSPRVR